MFLQLTFVAGAFICATEHASLLLAVLIIIGFFDVLPSQSACQCSRPTNFDGQLSRPPFSSPVGYDLPGPELPQANRPGAVFTTQQKALCRPPRTREEYNPTQGGPCTTTKCTGTIRERPGKTNTRTPATLISSSFDRGTVRYAALYEHPFMTVLVQITTSSLGS
ncbi:hypothetical protein LshimejAT787_1400650 [Lyophyllum shimeji]|uniref:Uncharacterized protein n=1 Tax=Lyophyllum shimeji TaxID=47721 RepID=A0A9P3USE9_LYOSH|nr:hypothetical protein LshimejAT787_1400650 [Lyophyllum shimeji]